MVTIRVAIEQALPEATAATHRCRSLSEVAEALCAEVLSE